MHQIMHSLTNLWNLLLWTIVKGFSQVNSVEELYELRGMFDLVTLVSADGIEEFRDTLQNKITNIPGVKSTVTSIILQAPKDTKCEE